MAAIATRSTRFVRDTLALLCAAPNVTCTFESGLCSWKKGGGKGKWVRGTRTPSSSTGAAKGHGGKGYFMFLETSSPSSKGWTSYLTHAVKAGYDSIAFAYHMHGATMGELLVEVQVGTSSRWTTIFTEAGQANFKKQGDRFKLAEVRLPAPPSGPAPTNPPSPYSRGAPPGVVGQGGRGCHTVWSAVVDRRCVLHCGDRGAIPVV